MTEMDCPVFDPRGFFAKKRASAFWALFFGLTAAAPPFFCGGLKGRFPGLLLLSAAACVFLPEWLGKYQTFAGFLRACSAENSIKPDEARAPGPGGVSASAICAGIVLISAKILAVYLILLKTALFGLHPLTLLMLFSANAAGRFCAHGYLISRGEKSGELFLLFFACAFFAALTLFSGFLLNQHQPGSADLPQLFSRGWRFLVLPGAGILCAFLWRISFIRGKSGAPEDLADSFCESCELGALAGFTAAADTFLF